MKQLVYCTLLAVAIAACHSKEDAPAPDSLVGRWQLTARQCYCPAGPVPNETLVFDASGHFHYFRGGQLTNEGTYNTSLGEVCSGAPRQPLLRFVVAPSTSSYQLVGGSYTLQSNTLVIDEGTHCLADVPVSTFQRQP